MPETSPHPVTTIDGLATRAATYIAVHLAVAEILGRWATADSDDTAAGVRPFYASWAQHHAWHAELWSGRHPSVPHLDGDTAIADARARLAPTVDALVAAHGDAERLRTVDDLVLAPLAELLAAHRSEIDERLDVPTARILDLVAADVHRDRESLHRLLAATAPHSTPTPDAVLRSIQRAFD